VKPLRVGFAGCGEVAFAKHIPALQELKEFTVAAIADHDASRRGAARKACKEARLYDDVASLISDDSLDIIAVCLPPAMQSGTAIAALNSGKHIWIDPPVALTMSECESLITEASKSDRFVMVGFHMRWHRLVREARHIVASGRLGDIQTIRGAWNSPRRASHLKEWRRYRKTGGGALVEVALDIIDLWRFLLDTEVGDIVAHSIDDEWEDAAGVLSGHMANGVLASAVFSERSSHDIVIEIGGADARLKIDLIRFEGLEMYGTEEMPSAPRARVARAAHFLGELPRAIPRMSRAGDYRMSYIAQWRHFADCVSNGTAPESTLEDARRALMVSLAAQESAAKSSVSGSRGQS
jgi:predicted dehydrogenase